MMTATNVCHAKGLDQHDLRGNMTLLPDSESVERSSNAPGSRLSAAIRRLALQSLATRKAFDQGAYTNNEAGIGTGALFAAADHSRRDLPGSLR